MKSLVGDIPLLQGTRTCGEHLAIGYFNQHQLEALDLEASPALHIQRLSPKAREQDIRNFLGGFDFRGDRAFETIRHFSGGEKARLALALIAWQKPNLLLLDEPTNHLDLDMREALTLALQAYPGAVVVISHDRHLLRNTVDEFVLVANGGIDAFEGDLEDYHQWLSQHQNAQASDNKQTATSDSGDKVDKKAQRQQAAQLRKQLQPLKNQLKKLEAAVDRQQQQLDDIEQQLADPDLYLDQHKQQLQDLLQQQATLKTGLENDEEQWLAVTDEYEALQDQLTD
ncbi:MAG: ATP-binding cassette domain-containing protein [Pseudomonadota bacterium]